MKYKHLLSSALLLGYATSGMAQATLLKDINPGTKNGVFYVVGTKVMNNKLYFAAQDADMNLELWSTDGTTANTLLLKDINTPNGSSPGRFFVHNNTVFFTAMTAAEGTELYKTDGTTAGTLLVKDIWPGATSSFPSNFYEHNGALYLTAEEPNSGGFHHVLYKTDGTAANTTVLTTDSWTMGTRHYLPMNGKFYFNSNSNIAATGIELWESDGTAAGTVLVKDILAGSTASNPEYLTALGNNKFVFSATDPATGYELYVSDGTAAGTMMVKDIKTGNGNSYPSNFKAWNGKVYFIADDGVNGAEPWVTDGTPTGTMMLANTDNAATSGSVHAEFCLVNNKLLFSAKSASNGVELWETDGTTAGTKLFMDINNGTKDGVHDVFGECVIDGRLYFVGNDGANGNEPWVTDGTAAGTKMLHNIAAGADSSMWTSEYRFKKAGNKILFVANDSLTGSEIWVIDAPVSVSTVAAAEENISIYPNPSNGVFYILSTLNMVHVEVLNAGGQVVYSGSINNNTIDLRNNPAGVYFTRLTDKQGHSYSKTLQVTR